jgi:hypothetical protein
MDSTSANSMFNRALHLLLTVSLFACPLVCRGGDQCCGNEHATLQNVCCERCEANPAQHHRDRGDNPEPQSDDCCQCICGGAVVEAGTPSLVLDEPSWIWTSVADLFHSAVTVPQFKVVNGQFLSDDGMNPGRAMRFRFMSLLC